MFERIDHGFESLIQFLQRDGGRVGAYFFIATLVIAMLVEMKRKKR